MRATIKDIKIWIELLREKGFRKFTFNDLKVYNLDKKSYIRKANYHGYIRKIGSLAQKCGGNPIRIWEICDTEKKKSGRPFKNIYIETH